MKKLLKPIVLTLLTLFCSCENSSSKTSISKKTQNHPLVKFVNSGNSVNIDSLASYINKIPNSSDTIFLGFRYGMNKNEFRNHVHQLRKEGLKLPYKKNMVLTNYATNIKTELGSGYTFVSSISCDDYSGEVYTGNGEYLLRPKYSGGKLVQLNVRSQEEFGGWSGFSNPCNWLSEKILEGNYISVPNLFEEYVESYIGKKYSLSGKLSIKEKGNGFLIRDGYLYDEIWISKKQLFKYIIIEMALKEASIKESNKKIKV
jgi:hypothetical protein